MPLVARGREEAGVEVRDELPIQYPGSASHLLEFFGSESGRREGASGAVTTTRLEERHG